MNDDFLSDTLMWTAVICVALVMLGAVIGGLMARNKHGRGQGQGQGHAQDCCDELVEAINRVADAIEKHSAGAPATLTVGLAVSAVKGRSTMAVKPVAPLEMSDVQSVQLSLAPKLANGSDDPGPFTWASDSADFPVVGDKLADDGVSHVPDATNTAPTGTVAWVITPTDAPGACVVTVTSASPNVDGNSIAITVIEGKAGNVNLSAGTPVSDQ